MLNASTGRGRVKGRGVVRILVVHTFVVAACMSPLSPSASAQTSDSHLLSRLEMSSSDGIGNWVGDGTPVPPMSIVSSSVELPTPTPNPPMIVAAEPANPQTEVCLERIPENSAQASRGGPPNAPSAYAPLSSSCKLQLFLRRAYSPYTFATAAFEAGIAQMSDQWPEYGGGMQGWSKRYGATLADTESRRFIQTYLFSTIFHQDPRYFPSTSTSLIGRAWYAATRVVVTRGDNGRNQFNISEMLGALSTSALQNSYYPQHYRTVDGTISRFTGALSSDATSAILREFTPDLKRMFNKHCPRKIKTLESKLPIPEDDKP